MLGENVLRSAMASKLAYARTEKKVATMPYAPQLHGSKVDHVKASKGQLPSKCCIEPDAPPDVWFIDNDTLGVHAYAWRNGKRSMLIAFKGSSTACDVVNLLDARQERFSFREKEVNVHSGVLRMFRSIEVVLSDQIFEPKGGCSSKYITFCGHSLGGAIALFASAYYGNLSNNLGVTCHTFGAPRVGDENFLSWLRDGTTEVVNIVNPGDLVPHFPLANYSVDKDNTLSVCKNGRVVKRAESINLFVNPLYEHDLDTYINGLREHFEYQKTPSSS